MNPYAIEATGLRKSFGSQTVLDGIDLRVPEGSIFALLGPNGAGKTTLIHILSALIPPDAGSVRIAGYDLQTDKEQVKRSISLTGQFAAVDEVLTGEENLRMMCRLTGMSRAESRERTAQLLRQFDLEAAARKRASAYSGGMRRRLDLALGMVADRRVIFLDEPTTGLDARSRRDLWNLILGLKKQGTTILLTTQYLEEADQLADTIALIHGGRIAAEGTAEKLKQRIGGEVLEVRDGDDEIIRSVPTDGSLADIRQLLDELAAEVPAASRISIRRPSLDDVFLAMTGSGSEGGEQ